MLKSLIRTGALLRALRLLPFVTAVGLGLSAPGASADEAWPTKPVRVVVPFPAGGGTDIVARLLGQALEPLLGQSVVIDNRGGAGGNIGTLMVAKAPPDGYTVLHGTIGTNAVNQFLFPKQQFDPVTDFAPVTLLTKTNCVISVAADTPWHTLQELMDYTKKNPDKLNYGITNFGDACHLGFEQFRLDAKLPIRGIPYNSVPATLTDVYGGRVQIVNVATQVVMASGGRLRPLAVTGDTRATAFPNVPTVAESGFPGFSASGWQGYFFPAGTSPAIVAKLSAAIAKVYQDPEFKARADKLGLEMVAMPPDKFTNFVASERRKWSGVIKEAHITIQ
jgi:tripartite-type tricarboxylate transporter receptor subunit TctC